MATMSAAVLRQEYGQSGFEPEYGIPRHRAVSPHVRAFPNEDIYFWRKGLDNSRVARQGDPRIWETCWRFFSAMTLMVVLAVGLLLPNAINLLSGIQLQRLRAENTQLRNQQRQLALQESRLLTPERLEHLAGQYGMKDAGPNSVVHLYSGSQQAIAANKNKAAGGR
jgi:cell division protein FtsL